MGPIGFGCGCDCGGSDEEKEATREVVPEVVMIPCKYCAALFPQTATFCPNCGARRTD
jgi:hypothetical protein